MPQSRIATLVSVALDASQAPPLYVQLFEQVRDLILAGRLKPHQRLPSTRALARDLNVSRTTTLAAYDQLASEGYIEGREGSGAYVVPTLPEESLLVGGPPATRASGDAEYSEPQTDDRFDIRPFDPGAQDPDLFPFAEWSRLLAKPWRAPRSELLHQTTAFGHPPLRSAIASHLRDLRGVECSGAQIVITSGAAPAVSVLIRTLVERNGTVFVEDPGYPAVYRALEGVRVKIIPAVVDAQGFVPPAAAWRETAGSAAIITPSRQYPLGMTMPLARRLEVLKWAQQSGTWIIEDDYDSEYRYVGRPLSALMSLDRAGRVIYVGSFSKTMFKALRLGFVVLPEALVGPVHDAIASSGAIASGVAQPALAEFIASGQFAAHIRKMRRVYGERQRILCEAIDTQFTGLLDAPRQNAGMHIPAFLESSLARKMRDSELSARLSEAGLCAPSLSRHYRSAPPRQGLLLGFAAFQPDVIRKKARQMAKVLARL